MKALDLTSSVSGYLIIAASKPRQFQRSRTRLPQPYKSPSSFHIYTFTLVLITSVTLIGGQRALNLSRRCVFLLQCHYDNNGHLWANMSKLEKNCPPLDLVVMIYKKITTSVPYNSGAGHHSAMRMCLIDKQS